MEKIKAKLLKVDNTEQPSDDGYLYKVDMYFISESGDKFVFSKTQTFQVNLEEKFFGSFSWTICENSSKEIFRVRHETWLKYDKPWSEWTQEEFSNAMNDFWSPVFENMSESRFLKDNHFTLKGGASGKD